MATLALNVSPVRDSELNSEMYARDLIKGLPNVTFTMHYGADENGVFTGPRDELETILWRYVTPLTLVKRGTYVNEHTASDEDRLDFEHFSNWLED